MFTNRITDNEVQAKSKVGAFPGTEGRALPGPGNLSAVPGFAQAGAEASGRVTWGLRLFLWGACLEEKPKRKQGAPPYEGGGGGWIAFILDLGATKRFVCGINGLRVSR